MARNTTRKDDPGGTATEAGRAPQGGPGEAEKKKTNDKPKQDGTRETIESVVIAFILAFLFRTFEAEAFVIPTGSMAPTLQGRHKDVDCEQCGTFYRVGASDEVDNDGFYRPENRLTHAACPNCRYLQDIKDLPVFKGDRILVTKFSYEFGDPRRWDVCVFKYPEDPKTNYIKRLAGLPGETIELRQGNVYAHRNGKAEIVRKDDPNKQRELQILVHDNDRPETLLLEQGWPERWAPVRRDNAEDAIASWSEDDRGWVPRPEDRAFELPLDRTGDGRHRWVRYRHFLPSPDDWQAVTADPPRRPDTPQPRLITDFTGYNAFVMRWGEVEEGLYWVGDLTLSGRVEVQDVGEQSELLLELNEGVRQYRCLIDLATGGATLYYPSDLRRDPDDEDVVVLAQASTRMQGPGQYDLTFANVDDRLSLWVNGRLVDFGRDEAGRELTEYQPHADRPIQRPWDEDLIPAGIAARGAAVRVSRLRLERDIYYRGEYIQREDFQLENGRPRPEYTGSAAKLRTLVHDPEAWGEEYVNNLLRDDPRVDPAVWMFELGPDEYFMLGDNSPRSKDSRLWSNIRRAVNRHAVPRTALVGKAFNVYWPHGIPFMNNGRGYPDTPRSVWNNPLTARLFYHQTPEFDHQGRLVAVRTTDYPSFRIPFRPDWSRILRRIR